MTSQHGARQIIKVPITGVAGVALAMGLRVIKAPLDKPSRTTGRTENTIGPPEIADRFKALGIINEILVS